MFIRYVQHPFKKITLLCFCILAIFGLKAKNTYTDTHSFKSKFKENNVLIVAEGTKISGIEHLSILNLNIGNDVARKIYINEENCFSGVENVDANKIFKPVNFAKKQSKSLVRTKTKKKVTITFKSEKSLQYSRKTICYPKKENHCRFILSKISPSAIANSASSFHTDLFQYVQCPIIGFLIFKDSEKHTYRNKDCFLSSYSQVHITRPPPSYKKITNSI